MLVAWFNMERSQRHKHTQDPCEDLKLVLLLRQLIDISTLHLGLTLALTKVTKGNLVHL